MSISKDEAIKRLLRMYRDCDNIENCGFGGDCTTKCHESVELAIKSIRKDDDKCVEQ